MECSVAVFAMDKVALSFHQRLDWSGHSAAASGVAFASSLTIHNLSSCLGRSGSRHYFCSRHFRSQRQCPSPYPWKLVEQSARGRKSSVSAHRLIPCPHGSGGWKRKKRHDNHRLCVSLGEGTVPLWFDQNGRSELVGHRFANIENVTHFSPFYFSEVDKWRWKMKQSTEHEYVAGGSD